MTPRDDNPDPDPLADLIASAGAGGPAPDPDFLTRLRDDTTAAFLAAGNPPTPAPRPRRFAMRQVLTGLSAAVVAAAVLVAAIHLWPSSAVAGPSLGQVFEGTAGSDTLHLRVERGDTSADVWVSRPGKLRWEESDGHYKIARGGRLLTVDEPANRVTQGLNNLLTVGGTVDLFALLDMGHPSAKPLYVTFPSERVERDGRPVNLYRMDANGRHNTPLTLEAEADATAGKLLTVRAFARGGVPRLVAAFTVLAAGQPIPDKVFALSPTLSEDGRVGKVADVQGVVGLRPVGASRWTPVRANALLLPGDWVRTDPRGANAATLRLLPQAAVVVGPGALVEVVKPTRVRIHQGEAEVTPAKGHPIELTGPGDEKVTVTERTHYRVQNDRLVLVEQPPKWLAGFKGVSANESLGSLVAQVDGRNVPLTVGTHKVTVDVRDQIARTTIEETFVNHTDAQLEGQFHFPLPQDASIAGFAMWIGDQMVDADVVEKQRAREIYEEIMREKRDPGLLEWTGGNIFKARVWPIFAHSEKRVRITYTQVLPLQNGRYRYSYALQSEMFQQHPLKDLSITVNVSSALPLKAVTCQTHTVREQATAHAAKLEFAAQEYTPTRDFEAVVEIAEAVPEVVVVPHRRGSDGYFLVQVTPPAPPAAERPLVPDAGPVQLVLLCDTSASMDPGQRGTQAAVASALLGALTPKDSFNLGACDVNADWAFAQPQPATPENVVAALDFLGRRVSLGWTDLDKGFESALKQAGPGCPLVYLGDGISTTGDANPQAFADRLRAAYTAAGSTATLHAVALGSAFEPGVLKAVGSLGGGSVRRVTAEQGPAAVALELLGEITRPPVRDLAVEFRGWRTASVYPERLPNLVPGTQQTLIGRYLPEGADQRGEVVVSGTRDGKAVSYRAAAVLKDAESGNSFIPRLWARAHLEKLLERPHTPAVKDEVIALSEEFHIMTPYTSFLVLESDADRERFGVKRRFQMRDGEQFFADGKDRAAFDLAREQSRRAGLWRAGLRQDVLARLMGFGRDPRLIDPVGQPMFFRRDGKSRQRLLSAGGGWDDDRDDYFGKNDFRQPVGQKLGEIDALQLSLTDGLRRESFDPADEQIQQAAREGRIERLQDAIKEAKPDDGPEEVSKALEEYGGRRGLDDAESNGEFRERLTTYEFGVNAERKSKLSDSRSPRTAGGAFRYGIPGFDGQKNRGYLHGQGYTRWFDGVIPDLATGAVGGQPPKSNWPKEARDLARSLLRRDVLATLDGGLWVYRRTDIFSGNRNRTMTGRVVHDMLYSPTGWAVRTDRPSTQTVIEWCDGKNRGIVGTGFGLGRVRPAVAADLRDAPLPLDDFLLTPLDERYPQFTASVERDREYAVLVLRHEASRYEMRFFLDTTRHLLAMVRRSREGKPEGSTGYFDPVEAAGVWWNRREETTGENGQHSSTTYTSPILIVEAGDFAKRTREMLVARDGALLFRSPEPTVAAAKKAVATGKASAADHFELLVHYAGYQQWAKAGEHLDALEKLAADKPGVRWLRTIFLQASRRGEEVRTRLLAEAAPLAKQPPTWAEAFLQSGNRLAVAEFVFRQGSSVLAANEQLALLDALRPAYLTHPEWVPALRQWKQHRADLLQNTGRVEEALATLKELANDYPYRDQYVQTRYLQLLWNRGEHEAAFEWLSKMLALGDAWTASEQDQFRNQTAYWLEEEGRLTDQADFLAAWVKLEPEFDTPYSRYLSALIRTGDQAKADDQISAWLKDVQRPGDIPPAVRARFTAAANTAVGRGHNLSSDRIDPKWVGPLAQSLRSLAAHPVHDQLAEGVLGTWQFQATDEVRKLRLEALDRLVRDAATMPVPRLARQLNPLLSQPPAVEAAVWKALADTLLARWRTEPDADLRHQLGQSLQTLVSRTGPGAHVAFLREQWEKGPKGYRPGYGTVLFDALIGQVWSAEAESEAITLLPKLGDPDQPDNRLTEHVGLLHRLTDRMTQARFESLTKAVANPEKLTRTDLSKKRAEALDRSRREFADRLKAAAEAWPAGLRPWAAAERLFLLARTNADPAPLAAECWAVLGDAPKVAPPPDEDDPQPPTAAERLDLLLRARYLATVMQLATRTGAAADLVARTLKYIDAGIAAAPADPAWKGAKFQLLVALDRPKELEAALAAWAKEGDADGRWRTAFGYVLAEQGKLADAVALLEAVEKDAELGYAEYRSLAGWYTALNRREANKRALVQGYKTVNEYQLSQLINAKLSPWRRGDGNVPTELEPDVLRMFAALFGKATAPQNYLYQLQQFYGACRDFRLLAVAADAVVGQSAGSIYPFLSGMQSVLTEVRDEAAADKLLERVDSLRTTAKTPTDLRALDLLEVQVRRRAAEVTNQAGPHAEKALTSLKRAFDRPWADGERPMMSDLLRELGHITRADLAAEQLRQLRELHAAGAKGTYERLRMAHNHAMVLAHQSRQADAVEVLRAALDEFAGPTADANGPLQTLVSYLEGLNRAADAEALMQGRVGKPANGEQRKWLALRLDELYHRCLQRDAVVSLGAGSKLYQALERRLVGEIATADPNHRYQLVHLLCGVYRTAHGKKFPAAAADLRAFAANALPPILKRQTTNLDSLVSEVARAVRELSGPADGIAFLLDRIDQEPKWLKLNSQDGWARHAYTMGSWRIEAKTLPPDLDARLLAVTLAELRDDLRTGRSRQRYIYYAQHGYYWTEREEEFVKVAEEVAAERKDSATGVRHLADYFYRGCRRPGRAIELLFDARGRKLLDEDGEAELVRCLHEQNRHAESVPLLTALVERRPDKLAYRGWLFTALDRTNRRADLAAAFAAAEKHFRDKARWTEDAMAGLALPAVECKLFDRAVAIFGELIPLHQRSAPRRGVGDGTLSRYYQQLAHAHAGMGNTIEAIDAAGGAIVAWGGNVNGRAEALRSLNDALTAAKDLDAVVRYLDAETAATGLVNPVVRKAVGRAYAGREQFPAAVTQFQLALNGQPNDAETLKGLIDCFDRMKDPEGAVAQVLRALELTRRDIKRYEELGNRLTALGRPAEAERAFTSIVEVLPNESEGHALLADVRQRQGRWADAAGHWEQVARIRALEPTGLLGLAAAQVKLRKLDEAAANVEKLKARAWPAHFGDAPTRIAEVERQLREARVK